MQIADLGVTRETRPPLSFYLRGAVLLGVLAAGFIGFSSGVEVTERPGMPNANFGTRLYYAIALFVLGGIDLGTPCGGPLWGRALLWFAYLSAPAVTASALIEGILRAINPERWGLRSLRNHVVIGGCSRLALLFLRRLRENENNCLVVVVDDTPDPTAQAIVRSRRAWWLTANVTQPDTIGVLRLSRARRVLLLTGDDYANLDAASKIMAVAPELKNRLAVHVADLGFKRLMGNAVPAAVFNIYQIAADQLVETELLPSFARTDARDIVVFAGFGRLGQAILDELQARAPKSMEAIIIIDKNASERSLAFEEQIGFDDRYQRHVIVGNTADIGVWRQAEELYDFGEQTPAFLLLSGSDMLNLRVAMRLAQKYPESRVLARSYFRSPFAEALSKRSGFTTFSLATLIYDSLPADWFD